MGKYAENYALKVMCGRSLIDYGFNFRREKKQFEQYQATSRAMPNKKEREEIEMLKTQVSCIP